MTRRIAVLAIAFVALNSAIFALEPQQPAPPPVVSTPAIIPGRAAPVHSDLPQAPPAAKPVQAAPVPSFKLPDGRTARLGRQHPTKRPKLWLHDYIRLPKTATLPASVDYFTKAAPALAQMYGNDTEGDCVMASAMHQTGVFTAFGAGTPAVGTPAEALSQYAAICGPGDNGCVITDVLDWRKSHGLVVGGQTYKITDYVGVDWRNQTLVETAIYLFGAVEYGVNLPAEWQDNATTWDIPATGKSIVGGHDIPGLGYSAAGVTISTWGGTRLLTWAAEESTTYVEEAYVILSPDWAKNPALAALGVDVAALQADLALIAQGKTPTIPPTPPPAPVPVPVTPPPVTPPVTPPAPAVVTQGTLPSGVAIGKWSWTVDMQTAIPVPQVRYAGESPWWQIGPDGKWYTSTDRDALDDYVARNVKAPKADPSAPDPTRRARDGLLRLRSEIDATLKALPDPSAAPAVPPIPQFPGLPLPAPKASPPRSSLPTLDEIRSALAAQRAVADSFAAERAAPPK